MIDACKLLAAAEPAALTEAPATAFALQAEPAAITALEVVEPITLEQAKAHLNVVVPDDDALITNLILAARQMAEGRLNRTIVQRRRAARFSGWGDRMVLLKPPVLSVDSVGYLDENGEADLDPARYYLPPMNEDELPRLELLAGEPFPALDRYRHQPVTVYYTAGYPVGQVPAPIVQWMLLAIGTLYDNRASVVNGTISVPLGDDFMKWLLQSYMVYE